MVLRDCVRDWRIRSKGEGVGVIGMWLIRASCGRAIFLVRSKVWVKGISVGEVVLDAEVEGEPRSGRAVLTVSTYLVTLHGAVCSIYYSIQCCAVNAPLSPACPSRSYLHAIFIFSSSTAVLFVFSRCLHSAIPGSSRIHPSPTPTT